MKRGLKKQMNSDKTLKIILLRHGKTVYNKEGRLQSEKDSLTDDGKKQILDIRKKLKKVKITKIISSDEKRATESAEIISSFLKKEINKMRIIREKESGDFSGKLIKEVDWSLVKGNFLNKKIPNGESIKEVIKRAHSFLGFLNSHNQGEKILVISHGTFLRILFCLVFNKSIKEYLLNYNFPNASFIVISRMGNGKWILEESSLINKSKNE